MSEIMSLCRGAAALPVMVPWYALGAQTPVASAAAMSMIMPEQEFLYFKSGDDEKHWFENTL